MQEQGKTAPRRELLIHPPSSGWFEGADARLLGRSRHKLTLLPSGPGLQPLLPRGRTTLPLTTRCAAREAAESFLPTSASPASSASSTCRAGASMSAAADHQET